MKTALYIIMASMILVACEDENKTYISLAQKELNVKIEQHKKLLMEECRKKALEEAETLVDSIILTWELRPIDDSIYVPKVPEKPKFIPVDSMVFKSQSSVKPVLKDKNH